MHDEENHLQDLYDPLSGANDEEDKTAIKVEYLRTEVNATTLPVNTSMPGRAKARTRPNEVAVAL